MEPAETLHGLSAMKQAGCSSLSGLHSSWAKRFTRALLLLLLAGTFGLLAGCSFLQVGALGARKPSTQPRLVEEQSELQRFWDDFLARSGQALDRSADRLATNEGFEQVLRIKLVLGSSVLSIVSGPNTNQNSA